MITDASDLEYALRRWGRAFGEPSGYRDAVDYDERDEAAPAGENTIAQAMLSAGSREAREEAERQRKHFGRSLTRRRVLGAAAGLVDANGRALPVPAWASPPIRAPRQAGSSGGGIMECSDPVAELVERAALALYAFDRVMAVVLRIEYCTRGLKFRERVGRAAGHLDLLLPAREYRRALDRAKVWMAGRLT